jgi:hypothetical protein
VTGGANLVYFEDTAEKLQSAFSFGIQPVIPQSLSFAY